VGVVINKTTIFTNCSLLFFGPTSQRFSSLYGWLDYIVQRAQEEQSSFDQPWTA